DTISDYVDKTVCPFFSVSTQPAALDVPTVQTVGFTVHIFVLSLKRFSGSFAQNIKLAENRVGDPNSVAPPQPQPFGFDAVVVALLGNDDNGTSSNHTWQLVDGRMTFDEIYITVPPVPSYDTILQETINVVINGAALQHSCGDDVKNLTVAYFTISGG